MGEGSERGERVAKVALVFKRMKAELRELTDPGRHQRAMLAALERAEESAMLGAIKAGNNGE